MITISAREAKNRFGELLDEARRAPVLIRKHKRDSAVVLDIDIYRHIEAQVLDYLMQRRAEAALQSDDWLSEEDSEKLLKDLADEAR